MKRTAVRKVIGVPAVVVWDVISELTRVERFLPGVSSSELLYHGTNPVRNIILLDGSLYKEEITGIDHNLMELKYHIPDPNPFTYKHLRAILRVYPLSDRACEVCWTCTYLPDEGQEHEIEALLALLMSLGIKGLEKCCKKMLFAAY